MLVPIYIEAKELPEVGIDAQVGDKSANFSESLFTVEVTEAEAAEGGRGISYGPWEVAVEAHPIQEGAGGFSLNGVELGVRKGRGR